jgi:hypothetical protein
MAVKVIVRPKSAGTQRLEAGEFFAQSGVKFGNDLHYSANCSQ